MLCRQGVLEVCKYKDMESDHRPKYGPTFGPIRPKTSIYEKEVEKKPNFPQTMKTKREKKKKFAKKKKRDL